MIEKGILLCETQPPRRNALESGIGNVRAPGGWRTFALENNFFGEIKAKHEEDSKI